MIKPFEIHEEIRFSTHIVWIVLKENENPSYFHTRKEAVEFYGTLDKNKSYIYEVNMTINDLSKHRDVQSLNMPLF